jgi:hypothetical protein
MRIVRGTVTQTSPLLVRLDGASAASPASVVGAAPAAGARVHVLLSGQQLLVLAGGGDHPDADHSDAFATLGHTHADPPVLLHAGGMDTRGSVTAQVAPYTWWPAKGLPDSASSSVGGVVALPTDWPSVNVDVFWSGGDTTTTGDVRMRLVWRDFVPDTQISANGGAYLVVPVTATNPVTIQRTRLRDNVGYSDGLLFARVERVGGDATDTYAQAMAVYALQFTRGA